MVLPLEFVEREDGNAHSCASGVALTLVALIGTVGLVVTATMSTLVQLAATALIMGGTGMKALGDPHQWGAGTYVDQVNSTYLAGYHLDEDDLKWCRHRSSSGPRPA